MAKRNTKKDETKVASAEAVEAVATNDIPEGAEVVDGVTVDAPEQDAKVKCTVVREFLDKTILAKEGKKKAYRKKGDVFEADKARAEELAKLGYVKF